MLFYDPLYLMFAIPGLILSLLATFFVKSTFAKYSNRRSAMGLTGAQAAERMLNCNGVYDVHIERVNGTLTDHYDPSCKTLRLSDAVFDSNSLAAVGVACHEAGHALQHATGYAWLGMRSALVPVANFGSTFSYIVLVIGFIFNAPFFMTLGCLLFLCCVIFSIVTLPVEWDASARAKKAMVSAGLLLPEERDDAASVLNAAFMTYVASAVSALLTLLYYVLRAKGSRRD